MCENLEARCFCGCRNTTSLLLATSGPRTRRTQRRRSAALRSAHPRAHRKGELPAVRTTRCRCRGYPLQPRSFHSHYQCPAGTHLSSHDPSAKQSPSQQAPTHGTNMAPARQAPGHQPRAEPPVAAGLALPTPATTQADHYNLPLTWARSASAASMASISKASSRIAALSALTSRRWLCSLARRAALKHAIVQSEIQHS